MSPLTSQGEDITVYRTHNDCRSTTVPIGLGLLAFAFDLLVPMPERAFMLPLSHLLLLVAPITFGVRGAIMATGAGVIPMAIMCGDVQMALRLSIILMAIGMCGKWLPMIPPYVATMVAWLAVIYPMHGFLIAEPLAGADWKEEFTIFCWLEDMLLTLSVGAMMLNPNVWCFFTQTSRRVRISAILTHVLSLTSAITVLAVLATMNRMQLFQPTSLMPSNEFAALALLSTFIALPTVVGFRLALITLRDSGRYVEAATPSLSDGNLPADAKKAWLESFEYEGAFKTFTGRGMEASGSFKDQVLTGVCAIDADGSVLFMNDRFRALTDIALPGTEGRTLSTLAQESHTIRHIASLVAAAPTSRELVTELKISKTDGTSRFIEISLCPHQANEGGTESAPRVITLKDITDRRTMEGHLLENQRLHTLSEFVWGAAASIADTFTAIAGRASQARCSSDRSILEAALDSIVGTTLSAGTIAGRLMELSTRHQKPIWTTTDVRCALEGRMSMLQNLGGERCTLSVTTGTEALNVDIDATLFSHALANLVVNARDSYRGSDGTIDVSAAVEEIDNSVAYVHPGTRPGRFARIRVSDHGCGMQAEVLMHAGDPLFTTKGEAGHSGLGLSTVAAIMREHNGFMTVESKPEKGTTVSLYFPLSTNAPQFAQQSDRGDVENVAPAIEELRGANQSVLVLENRDDLREVLTSMVSSLGYRAATCRTGEEALKYLKDNHVDVVLLDESLSTDSAETLLSCLREQGAHARSILMTASPEPSKHSIDEVVMKPFDLRQLGVALRTVVLEQAST